MRALQKLIEPSYDLPTQAVTPVTPDSSTNKTDSHDITEILLKVALTTITLNLTTLEHHINHYTTDVVECVTMKRNLKQC